MKSNLCKEHFHLDADDGQGAYVNAYVIRSVSPSGASTEDAQPICGQAVMAVASDVLAAAAALGFYTPEPDESPGEERTAWAEGVLS